MFDWNDEELTNIIWGDEWERNSRNDSYPNQIEDLFKKGRNEQFSDVITVERTKTTSKSENGGELDKISMYCGGERALAFCPDSWPASVDLSSPNVAKSEQYSLCTVESNNIREDCNVPLSPTEKASEIFEKFAEDAEESDLVYGWANIGSFEDLDRIFSENDTLFGDLADTNTEEIWSDFTNVPLKLSPLCGDSSEESEINDRNVLYFSPSSSSGNDTLNEIKYKAPQNIQAFVTEEKIQESHKLLNDESVAKDYDTPDKVISLEKGNMQTDFESQILPSKINSSLVLDQQRPSVQNSKHFSSIHLPSFDGNIPNYYAASPVMLSSGYVAPPVNLDSSKNLEDAPVKPTPLTPKEKIEKLRRRQKMRAILAIQKQQMHFNDQAALSEKPPCMEGGKVAAIQGVSILPILETGRVTEKDDPSTISMVMENCSMEETILGRLQDIVEQLDMRIRLSVRDSLFRLAQSAVQRQDPNDTRSTCTSSNDEAYSNKDMIKIQRFTRVPDMETETNPTDRTVARLLFHIDLPGKPAETCERPSSKSTANGYFREISENSQITYSPGMKSSSIFSNENLSRNTSFFFNTGNPSKGENQGRFEMESRLLNE